MRAAICTGAIVVALLILGLKGAIGVALGYGLYALVDDRINLGRAR